jgi:small subunit ribosomal protein S2
MRAIHLYCELVSGAVLDGLQAELAGSGADIGARAELPAAMPPPAEETTVEAGSEEAQAPA